MSTSDSQWFIKKMHVRVCVCVCVCGCVRERERERKERDKYREDGKEDKVKVGQCQHLGKAGNKAPRIFYIFSNLKYFCKSKIINITK